MVFFVISGFQIPHGHGSVSISCWQLGNLPSFMTWSTIAHEYELPCARKNLFWPWPIHCFVMVLVHIAFDEIGHLLDCSIRPNLVLIRPWRWRFFSKWPPFTTLDLLCACSDHPQSTCWFLSLCKIWFESTLRHVHYPTQYSDLSPLPWPPPLCRWNSALLLFSPTQLWLKHFSPSKRASTDIFMDDC